MKQRSFDLLAVSGVFLAYSATTCVALGLGLSQSLVAGTANTIPVVICGLGVRGIVMRLIARPLRIQLAAHLLLCAAFCALSYGLLIVLFGLFNSGGPEGFVVRPFSVSGTAWQSLQNLTTYALIATLVYLRAPNSARAQQIAQPAVRDERREDAATDTALSRYFVKIGEELRPLDLDMVVSINGADDYAEVSTVTGKHLVRTTLTNFSKSLDPSKYIRVHRSWIVNTCRVARAEPGGGGRLRLHMDTGQVISTSRDGAKLFRNRVL